MEPFSFHTHAHVTTLSAAALLFSACIVSLISSHFSGSIVLSSFEKSTALLPLHSFMFVIGQMLPMPLLTWKRAGETLDLLNKLLTSFVITFFWLQMLG